MDAQVTLSFDETTTIGDVDTLFKVFAGGKNVSSVLLFYPSLCGAGWLDCLWSRMRSFILFLAPVGVP